MADTSSFSFTNTSSMVGVTVAPIDIKPTSVYGKVTDVATLCELHNKTGDPYTQPELLSYGCQPIKRVDSKVEIQNPGKVSAGVQYQIRLDEVLRTVRDNGDIIDDPIVAYITVRHAASQFVKPTHVEQVVKRLLGASMREDGTFRFDDLMVSALAPVAD